MADGKAGMGGWRIALNIVGAIMLVVFGSCAFCVYIAEHKKPDNSARAASAAEELPAAPAPMPVPTGLSGTASVANFTKDTRLDECADFTITLPPDVDASAEAIEKSVVALAKSLTKGKIGMSLLSKLCTEQFGTNSVLATCTAHQQIVGDSGKGVEFVIFVHYYNLDTLTKSDTYMKNCLDMQGDWQAVDKDSDEYREAVRARGRREMEGIVKNAQKMQESLGQ
jgi:hypothetical protein